MGKHNLPAPPDWASFFTPGQYKMFVELVGAFWSSQGREALVNEEGFVTFVEEGDGYYMGLGNLSQICNQAPMDDWSDVVAGHFGGILSAAREQEELNGKLESFDEVRKLLAVRLYDRSFLENINGLCVYREDLPGTITTLVYDLPSIVRQVTPEEFERWGRSQDEVLKVGIENVLQTYGSEWSSERVQLDEDLSVVLVSGEDFFAPTQCLVLERLPELVGTHGTLVGLPHRHALICYPIEDINVIRAVSGLIPVVIGMHQEGPGSLSPTLYWYHEGAYTALPAELLDDGIVFTPPDAFVEFLNGLAKDADA